MERRNFLRILFESQAVIKFKDKTITGEIENLSLNGILIRTSEKRLINDLVEVSISLSGSSSQLSINLEGILVRCDDNGMAIQFKKIDIDSFIHLKNVIAYNWGDEDEVMDQLLEYIELKHGDLKID
jgi:hypothetical protein